MGGKTAQLAFQYQNITTVLRILEVLNDGTCISAEIEKEIENYGKKELDIVLELKERTFEFYEIKSGLQFTTSENEIKIAIKKFLKIHARKDPSCTHRYYLIINPQYMSPIAQIIADLKKIIERRRGYRNIILRICREWNISDRELFHSLCRCMTIKAESDLVQVTRLCREIIREIVDGLVINTDHALTVDDLLNRFIVNLIEALKVDNGKINLILFVNNIIDWLARNRVAYKTSLEHDVEKNIADEKIALRQELRSRFTSIDLSEVSGTAKLTSA